MVRVKFGKKRFKTYSAGKIGFYILACDAINLGVVDEYLVRRLANKYNVPAEDDMGLVFERILYKAHLLGEKSIGLKDGFFIIFEQEE